ncbi:enoyl-CoA delta isomerase 1, mitochondrial isoform X2 [Oncorhynchus mykiss]|uniref:enoyl-CoA delta isomerase 1, mitochondrial isoform X1 n=1 Tax=Oncorhynchus mykiss TaxID=8022 RepID=UPI0018780801|nr:enoyl-CoA delta isomerase 1, mitochondrial isoform X1 [Oncorhynchus mykiss]XP_036798027.1 enoyl-CoA delta isomerase 1, mitochondrial isoform X2 [Oncorhynchus mykiss]
MANVLRNSAKFGFSAGVLSQLSIHSRHGRECVSPCFSLQQRNNSTSPKIKVDLDNSTGVAVLRMQSPPVNSLSLDFLTEFCINLEKLEMDKSCRGLIITSTLSKVSSTGLDIITLPVCVCVCVCLVSQTLSKVFSAGLDIMEMYGKSPERCGEFWKAVQEMWLKLYGSNMATIAAINGSSPAGGCLMSIGCDYRIMADNPRYSIGLNETQLGIVAPFWFKDTLVNTVGNRAAELSLELGLLYSAPDALKIGLVDQLVPEDQVLSTAQDTMSKWLAVPDHARQITKSMMRKQTIDKLLSNREADITNFVSFITKDSIQRSLRMYLEMLKSRKA